MTVGRKKDVVRDEVLRRLLTGTYRFGDAVSVRELCDACGASRQPVMTALNALCAEGFLTITAQVGCRVVSPSAREIGDFFAMFARLDGLLAELAATRHAAAQLAALSQVNRRIAALDRSGADAGAQYRVLNQDFHRQIYTMAQSPALQARQASLFNMIDFYIVQTQGFAAHLVDAVVEHEAIVAALQRRDAAAAARAAESHLLAVLRQMEGK